MHKDIVKCFQKQPPEVFYRKGVYKFFGHKCFPMNFAKLLTPFLQNTS